MTSFTRSQFTRSQYIQTGAAVASVAAAVSKAHSAAHLEWERQGKAFVEKLQDEDPEVRYNTWQSAGSLNPKTIPMIAELLLSDEPGVVKAAKGALERMTHEVGKDIRSEKTKAVQSELLGLLDHESRDVKVFALRTLSLIADDDAVAKIAEFVDDPAYQEEAVYCLERIPGEVSTQAIIRAADQGTDSFKQRCIAAIGNRKDLSALDALAGWLDSSNNDVVLAAMDAIAKIGIKPDSGDPADYDTLTYRQKRQFMDIGMRYFSAQIRKEEWDEARRVHAILREKDLYQEEEHYRCATIAAIAHLSYEEEAREHLNRLAEDPAYIVRVTAEKALKGQY